MNTQSHIQQQAECSQCRKAPPEVQLKYCAKCHATQYCSRNCQKADWKSHKKNCGNHGPGASDGGNSNASPSAGRVSAVKGLDGHNDKPFTRLDKGTWLHDRPEKDVYRLLIDSFRMRLEDSYVFDCQNTEGTIYAGEPHSLPAFRRFLAKVASRPGMLPPWWTDEKKAECERMGMSHRKSNWHNLAFAVEKKDVVEHYGDPQFPMQLRMFAETVYGNVPGGSNGKALRTMLMELENGKSNLQTSLLSLA